MTIKFADGSTCEPIIVSGEKQHIQGETRDALTFIFPAEVGLENIDVVFSATACETITVIEGDREYRYTGYTVRGTLAQEPVEVTHESAEAAATFENRIKITMGQRTYAETQLSSLIDTVDLLVMDSLME